MAIYLKNSLFIHIPKTGGRWVDRMIEENVKGYKYYGDKIYDGHASPDANDKRVFAFVREPAAFCDSLWRHRSVKKSNRNGAQWNWQEYLRLEKECQSPDYETFMRNCAKCENGVVDYYDHYVGKYDNVLFGKTESLCADFLKILQEQDEEFNGQNIIKMGSKIIGGGKTPSRLTDELRFAVNKANKKFCDLFGYKYE